MKIERKKKKKRRQKKMKSVILLLESIQQDNLRKLKKHFRYIHHSLTLNTEKFPSLINGKVSNIKANIDSEVESLESKESA